MSPNIWARVTTYIMSSFVGRILFSGVTFENMSRRCDDCEIVPKLRLELSTV